MPHLAPFAFADRPDANLAPWIDATLASAGAAPRAAPDELVVALLDGVPVALARVRALPEGDGELDCLFVAPAQRGQGLDDVLVARLVDTSTHRRVFGIEPGPGL